MSTSSISPTSFINKAATQLSAASKSAEEQAESAATERQEKQSGGEAAEVAGASVSQASSSRLNIQA
ncbi:MAG TPA: hypothetical protein VM639_23445 [Dongiaceae bacterium]|nr:hypothetical protein [Dongiaceae bacterium]